jgi:hypothetical protein
MKRFILFFFTRLFLVFFIWLLISLFFGQTYGDYNFHEIQEDAVLREGMDNFFIKL